VFCPSTTIPEREIAGSGESGEIMWTSLLKLMRHGKSDAHGAASASRIAWRSEPAPASALFNTVKF
jgi:hypothetical protein